MQNEQYTEVKDSLLETNGYTNGSATQIKDVNCTRSESSITISSDESKKKENPMRQTSRPAQVSRVSEKIIYTLTTVNIAILAIGMAGNPAVVIYHYVLLMPSLVLYRTVNYAQIKQQYYLIDFCYFGNVLMMIFMFFQCSNQWFFEMVYAITTGPMSWAVLLFRNSLVPHDIDRITSIYIHIVPAFLTYCLRWYTFESSRVWLFDINLHIDTDYVHMLKYLAASGMSAFLLHVAIYTILVYVLLRPGPEYPNSFRYLAAKNEGCVSKLVSLLGPQFQFPMYMMWQVVYCTLALFTACLCYRFQAANVTLLAAVATAVIWNGACYHVEVFSKRGFGRIADDIVLEVNSDS